MKKPKRLFRRPPKPAPIARWDRGPGKDPWDATLTLVERCGGDSIPAEVTPENLKDFLAQMARWYVRIAAKAGARVGIPFAVPGPKYADRDDSDVVLAVVTFDGDADAKVVFPDGMEVLIVGELEGEEDPSPIGLLIRSKRADG